MSLDKNLYELMSTSEVSDASDIESMDFVLNLEVLNACGHHCPGCFVQRKNDLAEVDLDSALSLVRSMDEKGLRFREVILSPTDMFSAINVMDVLTDPTFHEILRVHPKTRITTTAMFEDLNWDNFIAVFEALDNPDWYKPDMIMEFLVPLNPAKVLSRDPDYHKQFKRVLDFFKYETPKEIDWSFVVNVHHDPELIKHFDELTQIVRDEFNTIIEFLPSFFRSGNDTRVLSYLNIWREFISETVTEDNFRDIMLTIADHNHNGFNTIVVNYKKGNLYISPFIYEQILSEYPELKVDGLTADDVIAKSQELIGQQFAYVSETTECSDCEYLAACVGRNVLSFMEIKDVKDCIYPKDVLKLYQQSGVNPLAERVQRCLSRTTST